MSNGRSRYNSKYSRNSRYRKNSPKNTGIIGIIAVLFLLTAGIGLISFLKKDKLADLINSAEETETTPRNPDLIEKELYVNVSLPGGEGKTIDLQGLTRDESIEKIKSLYAWNMSVKNTNPYQEDFDMDIPEGLLELGAEPGRESCSVPDFYSEYVEDFVEQIYLDYRNEDPETDSENENEEENDGEAAAAVSVRYTLSFPDINDDMLRFTDLLSECWTMPAKEGAITSYDKDSDTFIFGGSRKGYEVNSSDTLSRLMEAVSKGEFSSEIECVGNETTADDSVSGLYKTISSFTTNTTKSSVRNKNISLASQAINGTIISPGQEFSFNDTVGQRTEAKGYGGAPAYNAGNVVEEVGGGVCQVSSTLYNAVFRAGLTTTTRRSHTFEPTYVKPGTDATVSWPGPDYKFMNNSSYPIGIRAIYKDQTVTVSIYGVPLLPEGETWSLESVKLRDLDPEPVKIIKPEEGTPSKGTIGSEWEVTKIVKKSDGTEERTVDHKTKYKGHQEVRYEESETQEETSEGSSEGSLEETGSNEDQETLAESKTESESKQEVKTETTAETKQETKTETRQETKSETRQEENTDTGKYPDSPKAETNTSPGDNTIDVGPIISEFPG